MSDTTPDLHTVPGAHAGPGADVHPDGHLDGNSDGGADWHRRVVGRSLRTAAERSVDRGMALIEAAAVVLERANGGDITVQDVADEAGQSLRTLYQYFESKDDLLLALFEEAMRIYARLLRTAIRDLDDPLERLAGTMVASATMPAYSDSGFDRGLARLRLRLAESAPESVGRAQAAVTGLVSGLVEDAAAAGQVEVDDAEATTFLLLALNTAFITTERLGNDAGAPRPEAAGMVTFCLRGLGVAVEPGWLESVTARLQLPDPAAPRVLPAPSGSRDGGRVAARKRPAKG
jgi:AcrR family transcriptional regulator